MLERDKKIPIEELIDKLKNITFHPKLGSIADKNQRTKQLIPVIVKTLKNSSNQFLLDEGCDSVWFGRQVDELKMDMATETVREFSSLQKFINHELIEKQFITNDSLAYTIVEIADNLDSLVALWSVGEKPTGSGDPFALRRYAHAVIFDLTQTQPFENIFLPLKNIIKEALDILSAKDSNDNSLQGKSQNLMLEQIVSFILERLRISFKDEVPLPQDYIEAVLAREEAQECNINLLYLHATDLAEEISNKNPLAEIFYRLHPILHAAASDFPSFSLPPSPDRLETTEERNLHARTQSLADGAWQNLTFQAKLQTLGNLKDAIDPFFERVLVMHKDEKIRLNRLRLLYSIYKRFLELADFTKIHHKDKQEKHSPKQP